MVKMSSFPKLMYRFNAMPIKILGVFLSDRNRATEIQTTWQWPMGELGDRPM